MFRISHSLNPVIPAKAGTQLALMCANSNWTPACAGVTELSVESVDL